MQGQRQGTRGEHAGTTPGATHEETQVQGDGHRGARRGRAGAMPGRRRRRSIPGQKAPAARAAAVPAPPPLPGPTPANLPRARRPQSTPSPRAAASRTPVPLGSAPLPAPAPALPGSCAPSPAPGLHPRPPRPLRPHPEAAFSGCVPVPGPRCPAPGSTDLRPPRGTLPHNRPPAEMQPGRRRWCGMNSWAAANGGPRGRSEAPRSRLSPPAQPCGAQIAPPALARAPPAAEVRQDRALLSGDKYSPCLPPRPPAGRGRAPGRSRPRRSSRLAPRSLLPPPQAAARPTLYPTLWLGPGVLHDAAG